MLSLNYSVRLKNHVAFKQDRTFKMIYDFVQDALEMETVVRIGSRRLTM